MVCLLSDMNIIPCCLVVYFFPSCFSFSLALAFSPFVSMSVSLPLFFMFIDAYMLLCEFFATISSIHCDLLKLIHDANFCAKSKYKNVINSNHNDLNQSDCPLILLDFVFSSHFPTFMVTAITLCFRSVGLSVLVLRKCREHSTKNELRFG